MPIIKKYAETLTAPLTNYNTFLVDDNPNSTYFKVTEFADVFTGGKNGFLIEGSPYLKETTEIKIQIFNQANLIYYSLQISFKSNILTKNIILKKIKHIIHIIFIMIIIKSK
jgi:hypothetical protein